MTSGIVAAITANMYLVVMAVANPGPITCSADYVSVSFCQRSVVPYIMACEQDMRLQRDRLLMCSGRGSRNGKNQIYKPLN
jgi:hypothetical protein